MCQKTWQRLMISSLRKEVIAWLAMYYCGNVALGKRQGYLLPLEPATNGRRSSGCAAFWPVQASVQVR